MKWRKRRRRRAKALVFMTVFAAAVSVAGAQLLPRLDEREFATAPVARVQAPIPSPTVPRPPEVRAAPSPVSVEVERTEERTTTIAGAAYEGVAGVLAGVGPEDVGGVRRSTLSPEWAMARLPAPGYEEVGGYYAVFVRNREDGGWRAERSLLFEGQPDVRSARSVLGGLPGDLVNPLLETTATATASTPAREAERVVRKATGQGDWEAGAVESRDGAHRVRVSRKGGAADAYTDAYLTETGGALSVVAVGRGLTAAEVPGFPGGLVEPAAAGSSVEAVPSRWEAEPEAVVEGDVRETEGVEEAERAVRNYGGVAGFWVSPVEGDAAEYGVRGDEEFFAASVIKVPVMISVYRKIEAGELRKTDLVATTRDDYAEGAGNMQWEPAGTEHTVGELLWLMMVESDNVATNVLVRTVGGSGAVNEAALSLGAEDTVLRRKVSQERAAVPRLDNQTTPRDMTTLVRAIARKEAASAKSCEEMLDLMRQNNKEWWIEGGVPTDTKVANKGGWLSAVYDDAGVVFFGDEPYVISVFSQYGPEQLATGNEVVKNVSAAVFHAQSGKTLKEYEKEQQEKREREERERREKEERQQRGGTTATTNGATSSSRQSPRHATGSNSPPSVF